MSHDVRGELRRDHEVDRRATDLLEVDEPPEQRLGEDSSTRIPLERDRYELGLVPAGTELADERLREDLRAATCEGNLRRTHRDSHFEASLSPPSLDETAESTRSFRDVRALRTLALKSRCCANAGSTYQRISFRRTTLAGRSSAPRTRPQRPGFRTNGRSAVTGQNRSAWARAAQADPSPRDSPLAPASNSARRRETIASTSSSDTASV